MYLNRLILLLKLLKLSNDVIKLVYSCVFLFIIFLDIITGSIIDFKKEMIGEAFVINNPKATASCGCGLSFSI